MDKNYSLEKQFQNIWLPYTQMAHANLPPTVRTARGIFIELQNGQKILDGIASWWSVCHGYQVPYIVEQGKKQIENLSHVMFAGLANEPAYNLASRLIDFVNNYDPDVKEEESINKHISEQKDKQKDKQKDVQKNKHISEQNTREKKLSRVFFSDSGSTAIEVAMKIAVQYFYNKKQRKTQFISFKNNYHGDTMGGMSLCDLKQSMHKKFIDYTPQQIVVDLPTNDNMLNKFEQIMVENKDKVCAVVIEPMLQAAGGMKFYSDKILENIMILAKKYHILSIVDECATGFYRLGKKFAFHYTNISPDILICGKALTAGMIGLAATITTQEIFNAFLDEDNDSALMHGPTFMGNPLACALANASLDVFIKPNLIQDGKDDKDNIGHVNNIDNVGNIYHIDNYQQHVAELQNIFVTELQAMLNISQVKEVRYKGGVGVVIFHEITQEQIFRLREILIQNNIFLRPFANILYFMPPLVITIKQLQKLIRETYQIISDFFAKL